MAQSLRRPLPSVLGLSSSFERRCFSQIAPRWDLTRPRREARPVQPPDRSIRLVMKDMMAIPSDIGLLNDTFVNPSGHNLPSIFSHPRSLLKLQWSRLRSRIRDQFSLLILKYASPKEKGSLSRSIKLRRSQIAPTAVSLHRQMYIAFAEGDVKTLRETCTDGLYDSFRARISARGKGEKVQWELVRFNGRAKIVSNRAARLPIEGMAVRQAVVRISSRQKLTRYKVNGDLVPGTGKEKDVVEYVVLQRKYREWKEDEWQVWGTTEETTLEQVEEWERRAMA